MCHEIDGLVADRDRWGMSYKVLDGCMTADPEKLALIIVHCAAMRCEVSSWLEEGRKGPCLLERYGESLLGPRFTSLFIFSLGDVCGSS